MVTLELLIDASVWDHSTLLLIWEHTWLTFSFISSSHLPYHSSTSTLHLHQILHFREQPFSNSPNSAALYLLLNILHGFPPSPTPRTSITLKSTRDENTFLESHKEWTPPLNHTKDDRLLLAIATTLNHSRSHLMTLSLYPH